MGKTRQDRRRRAVAAVSGRVSVGQSSIWNNRTTMASFDPVIRVQAGVSLSVSVGRHFD